MEFSVPHDLLLLEFLGTPPPAVVLVSFQTFDHYTMRRVGVRSRTVSKFVIFWQIPDLPLSVLE